MAQKGTDVVFYELWNDVLLAEEIVPLYRLGKIVETHTLTFFNKPADPGFYTIIGRDQKTYKFVLGSHVNRILSFALFLGVADVNESLKKALIKETVQDIEGFYIDEQDSLGNTVLHLPTTLVDPILVETALELGARILKNENGLTPYDVALIYGFEEAAKILRPLAKTPTYDRSNSKEYEGLCLGLGFTDEAVRRKSLESLGGTPKALPDILLLCNDGDKAIRGRALAIAIELIPICDSKTLTRTIQSLAELKHASRCSKRVHSFLVEQICNKDDKCLDITIFLQLPEEARKFAYKLSPEKMILSFEQATFLYQTEADYTLKRILLEYIYSLDPQTPNLCDEALQSKNAKLRECGLQCKYKQLNSVWPGVEELLLDKSNRIQDGAIYIVKHHSEINLRDYFVEAFLHEPSIPAIKGIEKCGTPEDASILIEYLPKLPGKRQAQALTAIAVLLGSEGKAVYREYLEHSSEKLKKIARKALSKYCGNP